LPRPAITDRTGAEFAAEEKAMARLPVTLAAVLLAALLVAWPATAEEAGPGGAFDAAQEQAIRDIVRDYLLDHPEVLIEAVEVYEERQKTAEQDRQRDAIIANQQALAGDEIVPALGNPDGDVLIVEFFDYRCPYCRKVANLLLDVVEADGRIRLVMKEFPILGPESVYAARAALAAAQQGKYQEFHLLLMTMPGSVDKGSVMAAAQQIGLDLDRLERDMGSPQVEAALQGNLKLAKALEIRGTPAFIIGKTLYPGALGLDDLRDIVARTRAEAS